MLFGALLVVAATVWLWRWCRAARASCTEHPPPRILVLAREEVEATGLHAWISSKFRRRRVRVHMADPMGTEDPATECFTTMWDMAFVSVKSWEETETIVGNLRRAQQRGIIIVFAGREGLGGSVWQDRRKAIALGADDYCSRPHLLWQVEKALDRFVP